MIESSFLKEKSLLLKTAEHFIGKNRFERIGVVKFSVCVFDSDLNDERVNKEIYDRIEVLYSEFVSQYNKQYVIAISDDFDLVDRDEIIPEYKVIISYVVKECSGDIGDFSLTKIIEFDEFVEQITKDFVIKFERVL